MYYYGESLLVAADKLRKVKGDWPDKTKSAEQSSSFGSYTSKGRPDQQGLHNYMDDSYKASASTTGGGGVGGGT